VVGESWGARLRFGEPPEPSQAVAALARAAASGVHIAELDDRGAAEVAALDTANHHDYPVTPATPHVIRDADAVLELLRDGHRLFGATLDGRLVGVTAIKADGTTAETEFTSVAAGARRRGIGAGVKAASVLALLDEGVRTFGTGGAAANAASLAMNRAVGYVIEELWFSYAQPSA
jgi:hypothetical protein